MSEDAPEPKMSAAQRHKAKHAMAASPLAIAAAAVLAQQSEPAEEPRRPVPVVDASDDSSSTPRLSPAQRHRMKVLAAQAIDAAGAPSQGRAPDRAETGPAASAYDLLRAQLGEDLRRVGDIKSIEAKIAAKREMIATYADHVATVLATAAETGKALQDEIFVTIMVWCFDCAVWDIGLTMAEHVLKFKLTLPERFQRTAPTLILEEVAEAAFAAKRQDQAFPLEVLQRASELTAREDIGDIVRAKAEKAMGIECRRLAETMEPGADGPAGGKAAMFDQALKHFKRALALDDKVGVVKQIEQVTNLLKKEPAPEPEA